jgi:hypothetical protein
LIEIRGHAQGVAKRHVAVVHGAGQQRLKRKCSYNGYCGVETVLMIYCRFGLRWCAEIANTNIRYFFSGETLAEQQVNVRAFAETLANYQDDIYKFFDAPDLPPGELQQQLFGDTNSIMFDGEFDLVFDDALECNLDRVGEFILELLM